MSNIWEGVANTKLRANIGEESIMYYELNNLCGYQ